MDGDVTLPRLLAMAFRLLIDQLHDELAASGYVLRPAHGFALVAIGDAGTTATRLAEVLDITKQGTAKLVDSLVEEGFAVRRPHADDGRARLVVLTERGRSLLDESARIQLRLEDGWRRLLGDDDVTVLRAGLDRAVRTSNGGEHPPIRPVW